MDSISSKDPTIHDILLPGFKCSDQPGPAGSTGNPNSRSTAYAHTNSSPMFDYRRPEAYERMAADTLGEELAQDATIWKLYLDEAAEHDLELVEGRHKSLDMLLLFAALFSAILTAFLIESKNLLQLDPQDASVALLLQMVQSQHRIELGLAPPIGLELPVAVPEFTPTSASRWINAIWFISLGLSLSASLIAMLGKEWLTAFLASRPRPAHAHALLRQSRLEGLERWWALHIIALLPSLLHLSLLLFSVGLVIYLGTLDRVVAVVLAVIVGLTTAFYFVTAILGAVYDYCPFVTEMSGYARMAIIALLRRRPAELDQTSRAPSQKDLQALLWLANNARDPAVVDCSYQALAGLHTYMLHRVDVDDTAGKSLAGSGSLDLNLSNQITPETDISSLLHTVITRFDRLSSDMFYLSSMPAMAFPRYMNAIAALASLRDGILQDMEDKITHGDARYLELTTETCVNSPSIHDLLKRFSMSSGAWIHNILSLPADAFASILISEYNLIWLAILTLHRSDSVTPTGAGRLYSVTRGTQDYIVVNTDAKFTDEHTKQQRLVSSDIIEDLREHHRRWLAQVHALLQFHGEAKVSISDRRLEELLAVLIQATPLWHHDVLFFGSGARLGSPILKQAQMRCSNSRDQITSLTSKWAHYVLPKTRTSGVCRAQGDFLSTLYSNDGGLYSSGTSTSDTYQYVIPLNGDKSFMVKSEDLWIGLLTSLVKLLSKRPSVTLGSSVQTCGYILRAYACLAPAMLQGILRLRNPDELKVAFDMDKWDFVPTSSLPGIRFICVRLMLLTLRYIGLSKTRMPGYLDYCSKILDLESDCRVADANEDVWDYGFRALAENGSDLIPLLELIYEDDSYAAIVPELVKFYLIEIVRMPHTSDDVNLCDNSLTPKCFVALISITGTSGYPGDDNFVEMLHGMVRRIRNGSPRNHPLIPWNETPAIEYLYQFTRTSRGFSSIAASSSKEEHRSYMVTFAVDVTHMAAGKDPSIVVQPAQLDAIAMPGFLMVVKLVTSYCLGLEDNSSMLCKFASDAIDLMAASTRDDIVRPLLIENSACQDIWGALDQIEDKDSTRALLDQLRSLVSDLGIELKESTALGGLHKSKVAPLLAPISKAASDTEEAHTEGSNDGFEDSSEQDKENISTERGRIHGRA
ncbi:E3 ubiquitin-protein ligase listerin [Ceratobasidium sp. AG-Ba]|nr:E3 ubiquitin-protein ligase listerin [Ceratobasidium sp. AG-Ba]